MKNVNHFHNTIGATTPELDLFNYKAEKQDELILSLLKERQGTWLTPFDIQEIIRKKTGLDILITCVRRAMTNLTQEGKLVKSKTADGKGIYGVPNHTWAFKGEEVAA